MIYRCCQLIQMLGLSLSKYPLFSYGALSCSTFFWYMDNDWKDVSFIYLTDVNLAWVYETVLFTLWRESRFRSSSSRTESLLLSLCAKFYSGWKKSCSFSNVRLASSKASGSFMMSKCI
jgi:hypothetical protein